MKILSNSKSKINNLTDIISNNDPNYILSFERDFTKNQLPYKYINKYSN